MRKPRCFVICSPTRGSRYATWLKRLDPLRDAWRPDARAAAGRIDRGRSDVSSRFGRQDSDQASPPFPSLDDQSVKAEAAAIVVEGKDQLDHQKEEIGPGPFSLGVVEPEPQIEDLQRADQTPEAHEGTQYQRYRR